MNRLTVPCIVFLLLVVTLGHAQVSLGVGPLGPSDPGGPAPSSRIVVDVFADVASTDTWTAAGLRATTANGAALVYGPALANPGLADRFVTCFSKPLPRNADARFNAAGAAIAGRYDPTGAVATSTAAEVNVVWFASPPATSTSPSVDGYIARVVVDITGAGAIDPTTAAVTTTIVPAGGVLLLTSQPVGSSFGTASATFDVPTLSGFSWKLYAFPGSAAPTLQGISPATATAGGAAFTLTVNGSNFNSLSHVQWNGSNLTTTLVSGTQLTATVPAANIASAGTASVRVNNPPPGGGNSAGATFTINNPVPTLTSTSPTSVLAGSASFLLTVTGSNYNTQSEIRWNGVSQTTTFISATQLSATIAASLIATPGTASVIVRNPGPGGGSSATLTFTKVGPAITSITPVSIAIKTPASPATTLTVSGSGFFGTSKVFANGVQLTTTFINGNQLTALLPASVQQTQSLGGIWISVQNFAAIASNFSEVVVGSGSNHGTIGHVPLPDPVPPGTPYSLNIEGCAPNQRLILVGDSGLPAPIGNWPTPADDLVLSVGSAGLFVIFDGIGAFGPPQPGIITSPNQAGNTPPGGEFILPGLVNPNPPLGFHFTLQAAYLDPASATGFRLTWAFVNTSN